MTRLFRDLRIADKLILLVGIFLLGFAVFGIVAFSSLQKVKVNGNLYTQIVLNQGLIQDILPPPLYLIESRLIDLQLLQQAHVGVKREALVALAGRAALYRKEYEERYAYWISVLEEGDVKRALAESHVPAMAFYRAQDHDFIPAVLSGALASAASVQRLVLEPQYEKHRVLLEKTLLLAGAHARRDEMAAATTVKRTVAGVLAIGLATIALSLLFSVRISRSISVPLERISRHALEVAEGKVEIAPLRGNPPQNEIGALMRAFNSMTEQLSQSIGRLRASEMKYRIVADNTYDWEFWRNAQGEYVYSSPSCERITGHNPAEFGSDQLFILKVLHPDDRAAFEEHQSQTLRPDAPSVSEMDYRIIAADGSMRWINHICCPVFDQSGNFLGKRGTNRDITEQKKAQMELMEAKEEAEAANRAKSAFISSMSHELRTPLNAIMGYTQILLRDESLNEVQRNYLKILRRSAEHLLALINDILDMGKIEGEQMELEEAPFDLPALLKQVLNLSRGEAEEKGLAFDYQPCASLPVLVRGDQRKLQQVLMNLLDNAVRYTRRGGVTVRVNYRGGRFCCEIGDTGIGIAHDQLDSIFEPFTQLGREGQVSEGTGLGLSIARHLVTLMGGKLEVESEPEKGSVFTIEIPLPSAGEGEVASPVWPPAPAPEGEMKGGQRGYEIPPTEKLQELHELAMLGDMRRIRGWGESLMKSDARYTSFAEEVRELAGSFKAKAITALVEQYLPKKDQGE